MKPINVRVLWQRADWADKACIGLFLVLSAIGLAVLALANAAIALFGLLAFIYCTWHRQEFAALQAELDGGAIVPIPPEGRAEIDVTLADGRWISGYLYEKADR